MTYYCDGFTIGPNPSRIGGGFTVLNQKNELIVRHTLYKKYFTNNEAEVLGVVFAIWKAKTGDTIYTDSMTTFYWVTKGKCSARPDLTRFVRYGYRHLQQKRLTLKFIRRAKNLAGIYNEQHSPKD